MAYIFGTILLCSKIATFDAFWGFLLSTTHIEPLPVWNLVKTWGACLNGVFL
jgi:hypothetical protein